MCNVLFFHFRPDSRFQEFIRDELLPEEPKKSILKRDSISFEEGKEVQYCLFE